MSASISEVIYSNKIVVCPAEGRERSRRFCWEHQEAQYLFPAEGHEDKTLLK